MGLTQATLAAEYSVIGSLLISPEIAGEMMAKTQEDDFTIPELRRIYLAAEKLFAAGRPVDAVTIRSEAGAEYNDLLMQCMEVTPSARQWRAYVDTMQEQTRVQRIREIAAELSGIRKSAEGRELIARLSEAACEKRGAKIVTLSEAMVNFYAEQEEKRQFVRYGIDRLDKVLFSDLGDFVVLAGRPSAGKTALALQLATHMGQTQKVGFYSLETSPAKLTNRIVANRAIVDFGRINRRELGQEEWRRVTGLMQESAGFDVELVSAAGWSVQDILSTALSRRHKVIFIDYLQEIRGRGRDRFEQVTNVSLDLHTLAQTHGILVVALSQLSRAAASRTDNVPTMTDLRESGQIEQDADAIIALYIDETDEALPGDRRLAVLKNKEGTLGGMWLGFDGKTQSFFEYAPGEHSAIAHAERTAKRHAAK